MLLDTTKHDVWLLSLYQESQDLPKKRVFTIETLHITSKINVLSFETNFNLLATSKVKYRSNYMYLKLALFLSDDKNLNLGTINRYHIRGPNLNVFSSKGLHFFHRNKYSSTVTDSKIFWWISLLSIVSRIINNIIHNQTMEYVKENEILYKYQSGYHKSHSTDTYLLYLTDKILIGI